MNDEQRDNFLRETLKGQPPRVPPSPDFRQQIMQRVVAMPVHQRRRSTRFLLVGGIGLTLAMALGGGYLLVRYGSVLLGAVATVLGWVSLSIDPVWVVAVLTYGLAARIVLTLGILVAVDRKRAVLTMEWS